MRIITFTTFITIVLAGLFFSSCTKTNTPATSTTPTCTINGTSVNIGSSVGGTYNASIGAVSAPAACSSTTLSHHDLISFSNVTLNLTVFGNPDYTGYAACNANIIGSGQIMNAGPQTCLDFSYTGTPSAPSVSYIYGDGYVALFPDGHTVKFIAGLYSGGLGNVTYIFQ